MPKLVIWLDITGLVVCGCIFQLGDNCQWHLFKHMQEIQKYMISSTLRYLAVIRPSRFCKNSIFWTFQLEAQSLQFYCQLPKLLVPPLHFSHHSDPTSPLQKTHTRPLKRAFMRKKICASVSEQVQTVQKSACKKNHALAGKAEEFWLTNSKDRLTS